MRHPSHYSFKPSEILTIAGAVALLAASPAEVPFLAANDTAMSKMTAAMEIKPSGDVDNDFVAMMSPHHQGAIEVAQAELTYRHNDQLKRIAQEIIVTQQREITAMRLAVGEPLPRSVASLDQISPSAAHPVASSSGSSTPVHPYR
jgi:hypothetical protein